MKIYIDILLLQYFVMNYFLIELSAIVLQEKCSRIRKIIAAFVVSVYSIIVIVFDLKISGGIIGKILLSILITLLALNPKSVSDILQKTMVLCIVTYLLGGILTSMINEIQNQHIAMVISIAICATLIFFAKWILKNIVRKEQFICNIEIMINEEIILAKALIDTGHNLRDVITGENVIIINTNKIEEMSEKLAEILSGMVQEIPSEYQTKIRMVTYTSIGNEDDVLYGVKADRVMIYYDGRAVESNNTIVAMTPTELKEYDAIISLSLIEEGNTVGNSFIAKIES